MEQGDRFCGECGESLTAASQAAPVPEHSGFVGERRQITVLFSDVVDSTEHARRLGLEGWRELVRSYHDICAEQSQRFEGNVAQYLGDGVLVYFGYPAAHESDAEGAVRAALGIGEALGFSTYFCCYC